MSSAEQEPLMPPESELYEINLRVGDEEHILNRGNTSVRRFSVEAGAFDHIRHRCEEDEETLILFAEQVGIGILKELEEHQFPTVTESELDEETIGIFANAMAARLSSSIAEE